MSTAQAKSVIDDLVQFGVPSILFSGGEPLMRPDPFELIEYTVDRDLRAVISTNGTLISSEKAKEIQRLGGHISKAVALSASSSTPAEAVSASEPMRTVPTRERPTRPAT